MPSPRAAVVGGVLIAALLGSGVITALMLGAGRIASPGPPAAQPGPAATPAAPPVPAPTSPAGGPGTPPATAERSPEAAGRPDAPEEPTPVNPPTPSPGVPPAEAAPLIGTAHLTDPAGDLLDSAGIPPSTPQPAADLTEVRLDGDGETLLVEFLLAGDVPAEASSLLWSLDIWLGETLSYTVTVQKVGTRVVSGVLDWRSGEQVPPPQPPVVEGSSVSVVVPRSLLADVDGPFQWQALGQADGGYEDHVPDEGVLTWFPGR